MASTNDGSPDLPGTDAQALHARGLAWLSQLGNPDNLAGGDTNDLLYTLAAASSAQACFMAALSARDTELVAEHPALPGPDFSALYPDEHRSRG